MMPTGDPAEVWKTDFTASDPRATDANAPIVSVDSSDPAALTAAGVPQPGVPNETRVLFLHSHAPDDSYTMLQSLGFFEALKERAPGPITPFREFLFLALRGEDDAYHSALVDLLRMRYRGVKFSVVMITDTRALRFWFDHLQDALPGVPAVFSGAYEWFPQFDDPERRITGAMERVDIVRTIEVIRKVRPGTRHVAVMSAPSFFGNRMRAMFEEQLAARGDMGVKVTHYEPTHWDQILEPFRPKHDESDPADAMIYVAGPVGLTPGKHLYPPQWIQSQFPRAGGVPVFAVFDAALGPDVIGGVVSSGKRMGYLAGAAAARILYDGVKPSEIPIDRGEGSLVPTFRWDSLQKWGIDEASLPEGSAIIGRPDTWLMRHQTGAYRAAAIGATAVACALAGVTWGLVRSRRRRAIVEAALTESERRLRHAVGGANLGIWEADLATGVVSGSDLFCDLYGMARGSTLLKSDGVQRLHPDDQAAVGRSWVDCIEGRAPYRVRYRFRRGDGAYRWFKVEGDLVRDGSGKAWKVVGVSADITEEKGAQEKLAETEGRFVLMASTLGEAFWVSEPDGWTMRYASEAWETLWGRPRSALKGHAFETLMQWVHPEDRDRLRTTCGRRPATAEPMDNVFRVVHPDGSVRWLNCKSRPQFDARGEVTAYVGVQRDITEKMESRRKVEESERRLAELVRNAPMGVIEWDDEWRCTRWDGRAEAIFGWKAEEVVGKSFLEWKYVHEDDVESVRGAVRRQEAERLGVFTSMNRNYTKSGEVRVCEWTNTNLLDEQGRRVRTLSMCADVTERERVRELLRASEERHRLAVAAVSDTMYDWDIASDRVRKSGNSACLLESSLTVEHPVGDFIGALHPEDIPRVEAALEAALASDSTQWSAEFRHRLRDGSWGEFVDRAVIIRDASGKAVRMVGAMTEVSAQREAERARRQSEERYRLVARAATDIIWDWDIVRDQVFWSDAAQGLPAGAGPSEGLTIAEWIDHLHEEDRERIRAGFFEAVKDPARETWADEYRMARKDGTFGVFSDRGTIVRDGAGKAVRMVGAMTDVTEARALTARIRESEQRLRLALEASGMGTWDADLANRRITHSERSGQICGIPPDRLESAWDDRIARIHPDDREMVQRAIAEAARTGRRYDATYRLLMPDGEYRWISAQAVVFGHEGGTPARAIGVLADVTEKTEAQEALRRSEERFRQLADTVEQGFWVRPVDDPRYEYISPAIARMLGVRGEDVPRDIETLRKAVHPDDIGRLRAASERWMADGCPGEIVVEFRVIRADGAVRWWRNKAYPGPRDAAGKVTRILGTTEDFTAQREADDALRRSELKFRRLAETIDECFWEARPEKAGGITYASPAVERIYGMTADEVYASPRGWTRVIHPEDRQHAMDAADRWCDGGFRGPYECEYRVVHPDGSLRWVVNRGYAARDASGAVVSLVGAAQDVTARVEAARRLTESQARFREIAENIPQVFWVSDPGPNGVMRYVSGAVRDVFGLEPAEVDGTELGWAHLLHPDDAADADRRRIGWYESGSAGDYENVYRIIRPDGEVRHIHNRGYAVRDASGRIVRITGLAEDITERERARLNLADSERRFREMAENIDQVFWVRTVGTNEILYVSPATRRLWGVEPSELLGSVEKWRGLIHPDDRARARESTTRWIAEGCRGQHTGEYRIFTADGSERWVSSRAKAIEGPDGVPIRIVGVTEDITERVRAKGDLERSLGSQRLLLSELDHRVKNNLAGLLTLIELNAARQPSVRGFAEAIQRRVSSMASLHAALSASRWEPVELVHLIRALVPADAPGSIALSGTPCPVPASRATALGMVVHELLSNSVKYGALGFPGGHVRVEWSTHPCREGTCLDLRWCEAGGPPIDAAPAAGLGSSLIDGFARFELRGHATLTYPRSGAVHRLEVYLVDDAARQTPRVDELVAAPAGTGSVPGK